MRNFDDADPASIQWIVSMIYAPTISGLTRQRIMESIPLRMAQARLSEILDRVCADREHVAITQRNGQAVVLMALDEFNALQETAYLLGNPRNASRLLASIASLEHAK